MFTNRTNKSSPVSTTPIMSNDQSKQTNFDTNNHLDESTA
ncbi:unnamed protein product, partial [Rotaria sp. Silwood2]